ncbi:MAG: exo-alpha-sialidase [Clostridia bacterium]|nr:exo-alpha-sialidase [Clostridia bacterium]
MKYAVKIACDVLYRPADPRYAENIRNFQGCPTIAVSNGGRIYMGWYSGGTKEPHMENYNLLIYSDDEGATWSKPLIVIPSSKERCVHALDIQLWCDPIGRLHVFWVQNDTEPVPDIMPKANPDQPLVAVDGYMFGDFRHSEWEIICDNPDADEPVFSAPRCLDVGFLRCKPTVLKNGAWLNFNYDQIETRYGYSISTDNGATYTRCYGAKKIFTMFDEGMAYQRNDGSVRLLARCRAGELAETISYDDGLTWTEAKLSGIVSADTRFFISRTPMGRILLVHNDCRTSRTNMTICLSEDDGITWKYRKCIDTRDDLSYPDADFHNGYIYLTYDRERTGAKEILFLRFTEEDIMDKEKELAPVIVSKP